MFSSTTKIKGKTAFVLGAAPTEGNSLDDDTLTFNYSTTLHVNSSFNGSDLLYTRIKTGNFSSSIFDDKPGAYLSVSNGNANVLKVDKMWYTFPVGDSFKMWLGAAIENYYMLASAPSVYRPILKGFALGGNDAVYGASTGQGFGAAWTQQKDDRSQPRFAVSANYTASSHQGANAATGIGGDDGSKGMYLAKVEYGSPRWQVSAAFSHKSEDADAGSYYSTTQGKSRTGDTDAVGLRAYWKPESTGAIPSISAGYSFATVDDSDVEDVTETTASWMVGLNWKDAFVDGNIAGIAFGQRQYATDRHGGGAKDTDPADDNFNWEAYYTFKVSDSISVTPAIFSVSDPGGDDDGDLFGGLVQTVFKF
jgi:hypothetical protein